MPDAHQRRAQVKQVVQSFAADFPRCRFLVTSRTYAYQRQDWKLDGFAEAVLRDFSPTQINHFIERWYDHIAAVRSLAADDAQGRAELLKTAIERNPRLTELAERPLLLTLMASLHAWRGGSLPEKREELYADAVDLLLDQWESPKVVLDATGKPLMRQPSLAEWLKVDRKVVRTELNRLAFTAHRDQPELVGTADIAQERLVTALLKVTTNPEVNPRRLEEYLCNRAGLLSARGEGVYTFPHRTFQEYLAACHLTDDNYPDQLAGLLKADPQRWREATLLAGAKAGGGSTAAVWLLADELCHHDLSALAETPPEADCWAALLAAQTLLENELTGTVSDRDQDKLKTIRLGLRTIIERGYLPPVDRALAGNALAVLGDDRNFDELIEIPAGPFLMGDDDEDGDARPQHELTLPTYKIGKYLVTNQQFAAFMEADGYTARKWWLTNGWQYRQQEYWSEPRCWQDPRFKAANQPVVGVSWYEAMAYCAWRTEQLATMSEPPGTRMVMRLPTEAEWEKAARGPAGLIYPWGDELDETKCNTSASQIGETSSVGMYPTGASPYGCLDMAGNVWEWTTSLWGKEFGKPSFKYPYEAMDGRENLDAGTDVRRVVRGGSWDDYRNFARCAGRYRNSPGYRYFSRGFRVVVAPISQPSGL